MKKYLLLLSFVLLAGWSTAQSQSDKTLPEFEIKESEIEAQLRFLASDELKGRRTGSAGNNIAARYIAAHLQAYGYDTIPGAEGYFQPIPFQGTKPPVSSEMSIGETDFSYLSDYLILGGGAADLTAEAVFAGHGWVDEEKEIDDYEGLDVEGKVVFVLSGPPDNNSPVEVFNAMPVKQKLAKERGAVALVEIYGLGFPWNFFKRYFGGETLRVADDQEGGQDQDLVYAWVKNITGEEIYQQLKSGENPEVHLVSSGFQKKEIGSQNVAGVIRGTDPDLSDEYILLTAHYDHVGVGSQGGGAYSEQDSIFNGARDNAMGTIAMLSAAKALALERPKRSVIVLAVTGEEIGLLGSAYYAKHPLIPLDQTVFNLNTDGAGYNDTTYVSVFGFGRTGTDEEIEAAAAAAGLKVFPDPAPEQNLFDRSDNVSFAKKGVPALTLSPGLTSFDQAIMQYYHQVSDEADSVNMEYFLQYVQAYAHLARLIANEDERPQWKAGDKYEEAANSLYEMER